MQGFMTVHNAAYAFVGIEQSAFWTAVERASEERAAMERYGTVGMNNVHLRARQTSIERSSHFRPDVEVDNHVFTDRARRTSVTETREKLPASEYRWAFCGSGSVSHGAWQSQ